jgi:hypothetical protein
LLDVAQLRHKQVGRCPRQKQADNYLNHDVPTERSHVDQDTRPRRRPANQPKRCDVVAAHRDVVSVLRAHLYERAILP